MNEGILSKSPKYLCIFTAGALGDVINLIPCLSVIRAAWPETHITGVGKLEFMQLLKQGNVIEHAVSLEGPGISALFSEGTTLPDNVYNLFSKFDLCISWMRSPQLKQNLEKLGIKVVMYQGPISPEKNSGPVSRTLAKVLGDLGIADFPGHTRLSPPSDYKRIIEDILPGFGEKDYMIIHPGSGSRSKNWPLTNYIELIKMINSTFQVSIAATFGPADEKIYDTFLSLDGNIAIHIVEDISLIELSALLFGSKLFIGNDSGVAHLAGALGVPTVTIYGPTDPGVWGVHQPNAIHISPDTKCSPCPDEKRRSCTNRECLDAILVESVFKALSSFALSPPNDIMST